MNELFKKELEILEKWIKENNVSDSVPVEVLIAVGVRAEALRKVIE